MNTTTKAAIIDAAMMGTEFTGTADHLKEFASILAGLLGEDWEVEAETNSYNGAPSLDEIPENTWNQACELLNPEAWGQPVTARNQILETAPSDCTQIGWDVYTHAGRLIAVRWCRWQGSRCSVRMIYTDSKLACDLPADIGRSAEQAYQKMQYDGRGGEWDGWKITSAGFVVA